VKTPGNITVKTKNTARLECAARGQPPPEIAWQKDGGNDFPAARERRMHVMPTDDVFFILNVKTVDMGTYSCTAQNQAGVITANASLTVEGQLILSNCLLFNGFWSCELTHWIVLLWLPAFKWCSALWTEEVLNPIYLVYTK
jgi:hypothetical protein